MGFSRESPEVSPGGGDRQLERGTDTVRPNLLPQDRAADGVERLGLYFAQQDVGALPAALPDDIAQDLEARRVEHRDVPHPEDEHAGTGGDLSERFFELGRGTEEERAGDLEYLHARGDFAAADALEIDLVVVVQVVPSLQLPRHGGHV